MKRVHRQEEKDNRLVKFLKKNERKGSHEFLKVLQEEQTQISFQKRGNKKRFVVLFVKIKSIFEN